MTISTENQKRKIPIFDVSPEVLIVQAPYYSNIIDNLFRGATQVLSEANIKIQSVEVPGALEIPTAIKLASEKFSGFLALGCVIRGETSHYETVSTESARGLSLLGHEGVCIGNGILTVENYKQAKVRSDPDRQNKGADAAMAVLTLMSLKNRFHD